MAILIFTVLNGMGVAFLLYVLVNFWKEGHRPKRAVRQFEIDFIRKDKPEVIFAGHPVSHSAQGGLFVIPLRARERGLGGRQSHQGPAGKTDETTMKRFPKR